MKNFIHYKDYYGSVYFDDEELIFYGKIQFIRALISYEATDAKGVKKAFEEAVDDYLELCAKKKIKPEISCKGSLNIRLGHELHQRIAILAAQNHLSINKFITDSLEQVLKSNNSSLNS